MQKCRYCNGSLKMKGLGHMLRECVCVKAERETEKQKKTIEHLTERKLVEVGLEDDGSIEVNVQPVKKKMGRPPRVKTDA